MHCHLIEGINKTFSQVDHIPKCGINHYSIPIYNTLKINRTFFTNKI
jgi:hypothetical protein